MLCFGNMWGRAHLLEITEGLLQQPLFHCVEAVFLSAGLGEGVDDAPKYCRVKVWVGLNDISCRLGRHHSPLYLGEETELGDVGSHQSLNFLVSEHWITFVEGVHPLLSGWKRGSGRHWRLVASVDRSVS